MPSKLDSAVPQQKQLSPTFDIERSLVKAQRKLKCDIKDFAQAGRLSGDDKDKRDLLLYFIWRAGRLKNDQIGNLLGISYSAVSHTVRSVKAKLKKDQMLQAKLTQLNSLFKL